MYEYYLHKEPILNGNGRTYGHEFSFRNAEKPRDGRPWPTVPVDHDVISVLTGRGLDHLIRSKRVFVRVSADAMRFDALDALPKTFVFEICERDGLDKDIILKSSILRKRGYQIAAEETPPGRGLLPFHQIADFIRIDTSSTDSEELSAAIALFGDRPLRRIATNVQDRKSFQECRSKGFDLFQGAFFIDPPAGPREPVSDSQVLLMQLSRDLKSNREIAIIENTFRNSPRLTFGLLQLINSAFFGVSVKVVSIRQAITLLGYESLLKWVALLLFTAGRNNDHINPVAEKAILRGRVMEALAKEAGHKGAADGAFITGMLSLFTVLFDIDFPHLTAEMKLGEEIQDALLHGEGLLGALLDLAEKADRQDYDNMYPELDALDLSMAHLLAAETDAIADYESFLDAG
jgi:c-di-GMP-related signal transduction protein